jgi:hypothetical protein
MAVHDNDAEVYNHIAIASFASVAGRGKIIGLGLEAVLIIGD